MLTLRLRRIFTVNFNRSPLTNILLLSKKHKELKELGAHDVVCLRSMGGDQCTFVHGFQGGVDKDGSAYTCLLWHSMRLIDLDKVSSGRAGGRRQWNDLMLADYAKKAGIKLDGLKTWREYYADLIARLAADKDYAS